MTPIPEEAGAPGIDAGVWLEAVRRATAAVAEGATLEGASGVIIDEVCAAAGWPVGRLLLVSHGEVLPTGVWCLADPDRFESLPTSAEPGVPGARVAERAAMGVEPVWSGDLAEVGPVSAEAALAGLCGTVAFPVVDGSGVIAVAEFFADRPGRPAQAVLDMATAVIRQLSLVADRARAAEATGDARRMAEVAHDAYISLDDRGLVTDWNPEAEAVFGWPRSEAVGRPLAEIAVPERQRQAFTARLGRLLTDEPTAHIGRRELTAVHRSGAEFPVEVTVWANGRNGSRRICGFVRDLSERKRFEGQLASQALHDRLTGLPNRVLLRDRVEHALARAGRKGASVALFIADLDRFKVVNESLGHDGGDRLLVAVAERLTDLLRPGDTVARMGGDEFALLCEDLGSYDEAVRIATRVLGAFETPFRVKGTDVSLTTSVGVALGSLPALPGPERPSERGGGPERPSERGGGPERPSERGGGPERPSERGGGPERPSERGGGPGGREPETASGPAPELLLRDADVAMYRAKERGRGRFEVFHESMLVGTTERLSVENELRRAISHDELRLYYQPIVHLDTGVIAGFEALVRWQHPQRGLLPPSEFIPPAEQSGLIVPLGRHVLAGACMQAATWKVGHPGIDLRVSVNVSAKQLVQPGWSDEVAQILAESGLGPRQLVLEITESVLMDDPDTTALRLEELRRLGVRIAIDDFGTGYSSLGYLRRLPVDILKIDKSFIDGVAEGPHESALARAVVKLASSLRLEAVAEGISTRKQLLQLRRLHCPYGQGFYFARPQPQAAIARLLELGSLEGVDPGE